MTPTAGSRLGPYEILSPLGAGVMRYDTSDAVFYEILSVNAAGESSD